MTQFKIGQPVRIIGNTNKHQFQIGETVRIADIHSIAYICENSDGSNWYYVMEEDIEAIDQPKGKRFEVGKVVRVKLPNISGHSFADGDIVKVVEPSPTPYPAWKCELLDGSDFHYLYECEMELIEQPEQQSSETALSIWNRLNPVRDDLQLIVSEAKAFFKDWPEVIEWYIDAEYRSVGHDIRDEQICRVSINNSAWIVIHWGSASEWSIKSEGYIIGIGETLPVAFEKAVLHIKGQ